MKKLSIEYLHIIILIIGNIFISLSIFHTNLWFDETYSVAMVKNSLIDIWKIGGNDVHPVLYYWMLRAINLITGGSVQAYRIFSVIAIILVSVLGWTHIRKDFGEKVGLLFSFISLFLPMSAVYANQIRMYSWAMLILTLFFIYSYRLYKNKDTNRNWLFFGILSLASIYIHYYGLMAAGITNGLLLIYFMKNKKKKSIRNIIILGIIQLFLYLPWLIYLASQLEHVSEGFWITLGFEDILSLIGCQLTGKLNIWVGAIISVLFYIYVFIFINKNKGQVKIKPLIISIAIYISVIIAAIIIQQVLKTPILYHRYLSVITGLYIFIFSYILANEKNKYITVIICFVFLVLGIVNNVYQIKENYNKDNSKVINFVGKYIEDSDELIYSDIGNGSIFAVTFDNKQYFYNPEDWGVKKAYKAYEPEMQIHTDANFIKNISNRIWVIDTQDEKLYKELFKNNNYKLIKNESFKTNYYEEYSYNIKLLERIQK